MRRSSEINMDEIANIFNVSKATVSKALNDKEGVSEDLRNQIKEKAEELGYTINTAARSLKTRRSYNIGILIAERYVSSHTSYYFDLYGKLTSHIISLGYLGIMEILSEQKENDLELPLMYTSHKIDGLIVLGQLKNEYLQLFDHSNIPVVFFDFYIFGNDTPSIVIDNFYSGLDITNYLIERGHKEIGFVGKLDSTSSIQDRFLGFYRALLEHHLPIHYEYFVEDRDSEGKLIDLKLPKSMPSAFVCNNDLVGYELIKVLQKEGYRVPEDISVVSFDNSIYSSLSTPQITTIDTNPLEMVEVVSKVMLKKLEGSTKKYDRILVKGSIIERDSVKKYSI